MKTPILLLLVVLAFIALFAIVNWSVIVAPTSISLLVTDIQAPIGLIMLVLLALVTAMFLLFVLYLQATVLLDARRQSRELQAQRELADKAEASRFTDLRVFLDTELRKLADQLAAAQSGMVARVNEAEKLLRAEIEQTENAVTATVGELDDRLERTGVFRSPGN
jgi:hypothetical protein